MAHEGVDHPQNEPQDIYEVVRETHQSEEHSALRDDQGSKQEETWSEHESGKDKKPHEYEVISEDFFFRQRQLRGSYWISETLSVNTKLKK